MAWSWEAYIRAGGEGGGGGLRVIFGGLQYMGDSKYLK